MARYNYNGLLMVVKQPYILTGVSVACYKYNGLLTVVKQPYILIGVSAWPAIISITAC